MESPLESNINYNSNNPNIENLPSGSSDIDTSKANNAPGTPEAVSPITDTQSIKATSAPIRVIGIGDSIVGLIELIRNELLEKYPESCPVSFRVFEGEWREFTEKRGLPFVKIKYMDPIRKDEAEDIVEEEDSRLLIVIPSRGGTTYDDSVLLAKTARESGILPIAIHTRPLKSIGRYAQKAEKEKNKFERSFDSFFAFDFEEYTKANEGVDLFEAFNASKQWEAKVTVNLCEILSCHNLVGLDINDVLMVFKNAGEAVMCFGEGSGEKRVEDAINQVVESMETRALFVSKITKGILMVYYNQNNEKAALRIKEMDALTKFFLSMDLDADVVWGIGNDPTLDDNVRITFIATGFK